MPLKPETTAWVVTITTFVVFCLACVGAVFGANWYLRSATDVRTATVSTIEGTVTIYDSKKQAWVPLWDPEALLEEGFVVRTDKNSRALVTLFDNSTVEVFRDSQLKLSELRVSRFDILAPRANMITLDQNKGQVRVGVARSLAAGTDFAVRLFRDIHWKDLAGSIYLDEGSYIVDADENLASLRVRDRGTARIVVLDQVLLLHQQQRVVIPNGQPPSELLPAAQELIQNGDFHDGLKSWNVDLERNKPEGDVAGTVTPVVENGQQAIRFLRMESGGSHAEPTISQNINRDLSEFSVLKLSVRLKLIYQSLSGGGYMGSEYPLMVKIAYGTEGGGENVYVRGFFYQYQVKDRLDVGQQVSQYQWVEWTLPDNLMTFQPSPRYLKSIEITASGHDFESLIDKVSLIAE